MTTRTLSRWTLSIGLALIALVGLNLLLAKAPVQARHAAGLINCSASIQACIDAASDGDTILIAAGRYTESLTLSKAVSLTGENRDTTIVQAIEGQRVLTVTGAAISNSVVISGLTFTGGDATHGQGPGAYPPPTIAGPTPTPSAALSPQPSQLMRVTNAAVPIAWLTRQSPADFDPSTDGLGGGLLITNSAQPQIRAVRVISNLAGYGGGLYVSNGKLLSLTQADILSNVAGIGGGFYSNVPITVQQSTISSNTVMAIGGGAQVVGALTLLDSRVTHNEGEGLYVIGDLRAQRSEISFNTSTTGRTDAIHQSNGKLDLNAVTVEGNTGGVSLDSVSPGRITNSLFARNSYSHDGYIIPVINTVGNLEIIHTTIVDTNLNPNPAIFFNWGSLHITDTLILSHAVGILNYQQNPAIVEDYNLFYGNLTNTLYFSSGAHSLVGDPRFVDPLHGDYHLRSDSAAIDHGINAGVYTDLDGNPRPYGTGFDIGAYEFSGGPRYVATSGNDTGNDCLIEADPCATVQHAIDVADEGEQVLIASGLYTQSATLNKAVSLLGANRDSTILHAVEGQRVLTVTGVTISNSVVISGLTVTGGNLSGDSYCPEYCGGGILVTDGAQVTIRNAIFSNNAVSESGGGLYDGGMYGDNTAVTLIDSQFISNTATYDGGGAASEGSITLIGGQFIGNVSQGNGGGLGVAHQDDYAPVLVTGTSFINNTAFGLGGGVLVWGTVIITGGYFEGNISHGSNGGGIYASPIIVTNTDFVSNTVAGWGGGVSGDEAIIAGGHFERNSSGGAGGGVSVNYASINGTIFISNTSDVATDYPIGGGGAFVIFQSEVSNAYFEGNQCLASGCNGGGALLEGNSRVVNTLFLNNLANGDGAAIAANAPGQHEFLHLTIAGTTFITKPAIVVLSGTLHLTDTIITSHTIAISNTGGTVLEDYNLFFGNVTNTLNVTNGGHSLIGDPKFVDPLHGDYHLRFGSAAIDHGVDAGVYSDLDGNLRPIGAGFDIGAYEYQSNHYLWLPLIIKAD